MSIIIIPARLESKRLPRKMLLNETGYPLIWHTIMKALESVTATQVILATDSDEIIKAVENCMERMSRCFMIDMKIERFNIIKTPDHFTSGTDRIEWVTQEHLTNSEESIIVNFQGDEPEFDGKNVDELVKLLNSSDSDIATFAVDADKDSFNDPNSVKVIVDHNCNAMYFSRSPIPYGSHIWALIHIGIYAFKKDFLLAKEEPKNQQISLKPVQPLVSENLEQLEWLQNGKKIQVKTLKQKAAGIDTKEDYNKFVERFRHEAS